jgi:hypothetical protein
MKKKNDKERDEKDTSNDVRYDFRIQAMFGSSLPAIVCMRAHVLFTLFVLCK